MKYTEYKDFVASRAKPGQAIIDTLTPAKTHLLHMAIGIMGEVVELAFAPNSENIREELGDIEFYLAGMLLDTEFAVATEGLQVEVSDTFVLKSAGDLLDQMKKYVVYNKNNIQNVAKAFAQFCYDLNNYYEEFEISRDEVRDENVAKLTKRYANGYSDKAAQERADKPAGE